MLKTWRTISNHCRKPCYCCTDSLAKEGQSHSKQYAMLLYYVAMRCLHPIITSVWFNWHMMCTLQIGMTGIPYPEPSFTFEYCMNWVRTSIRRCGNQQWRQWWVVCLVQEPLSIWNHISRRFKEFVKYVTCTRILGPDSWFCRGCLANSWSKTFQLLRCLCTTFPWYQNEVINQWMWMALEQEVQWSTKVVGNFGTTRIGAGWWLAFWPMSVF